MVEETIVGPLMLLVLTPRGASDVSCKLSSDIRGYSCCGISTFTVIEDVHGVISSNPEEQDLQWSTHTHTQCASAGEESEDVR